MEEDSNNLKIPPPQSPRQGWDTRFAAMAANYDDRLLDEDTPTLWDEEEWAW